MASGALASCRTILGPTLGGWSRQLQWRWVFYINLPVGILAFMGILASCRRRRPTAAKPFDLVGFASSASPSARSR